MRVPSRSPEGPAPLLAKLAEAVPCILGPNLVGLYVYGSAGDETFDIAGSDVDCIAVTERALTDGECDTLSRWLAEAAQLDSWVERLQMSFLIRGKVLQEDLGACLFQYGVFSRSGSDGNPIMWLDYFDRGRTLFGAAPESFLPAITGEMLREALVREIGYLREEMCGKSKSEWRDRSCYRIYAVLTLCRILYLAQMGGITTKPRAGAWALENTSNDWHALIRRALEAGGSKGLKGLDARRICAFIAYIQSEVDDLPLSSPPGAPRSTGG